MKNTLAVLMIITVSSYADFSFIVTNDMRYGDDEHMKENLRDAMGCIAQKHGDAEFMISPGDNTPIKEIHQIIKDSLGSDFSWYPMVGNHEADTDSDKVYLKECIGSLKNIVNSGPAHAESTMYSFDSEEVHFACINVYYDGVNEFSSWKTDGVSDACYEWLENDLETTEKEAVLVFGHVPAFVLCDEDTKMEYQMDSDLGLSGGNPENRDRFWALLRQYNVIGYFCGHQHSYYSEDFDGVYQYNAGAVSDNSASYDTYIRVVVEESTIAVEAWREYEKNRFSCKERIIHTLTDYSNSEKPADINMMTGSRGIHYSPYQNMISGQYLLNGRMCTLTGTCHTERGSGLQLKMMNVNMKNDCTASQLFIREYTDRK